MRSGEWLKKFSPDRFPETRLLFFGLRTPFLTEHLGLLLLFKYLLTSLLVYLLTNLLSYLIYHLLTNLLACRTNRSSLGSSHWWFSVRKSFLINFSKFTGKHLWQSFCFNTCRPKACNFVKTRLWHKRFPENFIIFLRTSFLQNKSGWLLLLFMLIPSSWFKVAEYGPEKLRIRTFFSQFIFCIFSQSWLTSWHMKNVKGETC